MPERWQRLHLANNGNIPPLLFKYSITSSGYEIYMTDLNYIWSEHLDKKGILKRADEDDTTIDPSEDAEQFKVLLKTIADGLHNEPGSKALLMPKTRGSAKALELIVTSKLPAPLKPLKWTLYLSKEPRSATTSHLLIPLITAEADQEFRQRSLIEELNRKDWVLGKLFDKIEAMGIDLSAVFPGASGLRGGRKGTTLLQAAKYIKGLAPFDEQSWREQASKSSSDSGISANIVAELSQGLRSLEPPPDEWWESLAITDTVTTLSPEEDGQQKSTTKPPSDRMDLDNDAGSETGDDDEFERQETPPRFKKSTVTAQKGSSANKSEDEKTQSDDELPSRNREKATSPRFQDKPPAIRPKVAPGASGRLGTIGGKKQPKPKPPSQSPSPELSPTPSSEVDKSSFPPRRKHQLPKTTPDEPTDDDLTDDDLNEDTDIDSEPPKPPPQVDNNESNKPGPKSTRGLGVIGGKKKKQPTPELEPEPEPEPEPNSEPSQTQTQPPSPSQTQPPKKKKPLGKIGVIGGQKTKAKAQDSKPSSSQPSRPESVSPPPPKSKQRQDKSDDELTGEDGPDTKPSPLPPMKESKAVKQETPAKPEREETEEEKADRKREELKRQLEAKSKAPVKKKRRF
ncbi:XRCC4-like factor-domain-containing protein [Aspergillus unguis]